MSERFHPTMTEAYDEDTSAPPCERCSAPAERITCYGELLCDRCYWRWEQALSRPCPCCYAGYIERYDEGKVPCDVCGGSGIDPLPSGDLIGDRALDADDTCDHGVNVYAHCAACRDLDSLPCDCHGYPRFDCPNEVSR